MGIINFEEVISLGKGMSIFTSGLVFGCIIAAIALLVEQFIKNKNKK